jgi:hypothetical protein
MHIQQEQSPHSAVLVDWEVTVETVVLDHQTQVVPAELEQTVELVAQHSVVVLPELLFWEQFQEVTIQEILL